MINVSSNNKRIAKNTLLLYMRMLFLMAISLFTTRIILDALGVEDYGIYNVVGGFVTMFSVLSGGLSSATQRFLSFDLGRGDKEALNRTFSACVLIYFIIAVVIVVVAELCGYWFLDNKLNLPNERLDAAHIVFHLSLITLVINLISTPYNALIISHERMNIFAYISIFEAVAKLSIAYAIENTHKDKLIVYSLMLCFVQLLVRFIYGIYCKKHFPESKVRLSFDWGMVKEVYSFTGWLMLGSLSYMGRTQGVNILLNIFFGSAVNAARGISVQVQNTVNGFVSNFQMALNPQIVKSYSQMDFVAMQKLVLRSAKFSFCLMLFFALPIMVETDGILNLWLKNTPEYSAIFVRLMLALSLIETIANPMTRSIEATGKIREYQIVGSAMMLSILPISYIVLKFYNYPPIVYWISIGIYIILVVYRIYLVHKLLGFSLSFFYTELVLRLFIISALSAIPVIAIHYIVPSGLIRFVLVCLISTTMTFASTWIIGLDGHERKVITNMICNYFHRHH